jgi:aminoglycoside phosphotransferase
MPVMKDAGHQNLPDGEVYAIPNKESVNGHINSTRLKNDRPGPIENTLIHGDFHMNNLLVNHNNIVGIIDWPRAAYGDLRFDVALAIRPKQGYFRSKAG